jgi:hypothetical protein
MKPRVSYAHVQKRHIDLRKGEYKLNKSLYYSFSKTIRLLLMATLAIVVTFGSGQIAGAKKPVPPPPVPTAPVDLGKAATFAILAKSGITNVPTSAITGDLGVSPIAATAITGFGLVLDSTGTFSTSTQVTGKVYAANYASPTPTNLVTAVSNMQAAYTDAAGRAPNFTELYSGNLTGATLAPGVYKWSTRVLVNNQLTLKGGPNDVWIFQIAKGLTLGSGARVVLSGGALAKNIFWQVAGVTALGTTSHMEGTILDATAITFNTGASLNGKALAQTNVTLIKNTIVLK